MNRRFNTLLSSNGYLEFEFVPVIIPLEVTAELHSNFELSGCFISNMALLGRLGPDSLKKNRAFFFRNGGHCSSGQEVGVIVWYAQTM